MDPTLLCLFGILVFVFIFIIGPAKAASNKTSGSGRKGRRRKRKRSYSNGGTITIYKLMDGRKAFYVGQTRQPLDRRLRQHMEDYSGNDKSVYMSRMRQVPRIVAICTTKNQDKANKLENKYMGMWGKTNMKRA